MSLFQAFVLSLIQGVTEFLPISSSAHLILVPYLLGWPDHSLSFDIVTNAGTLLAAVVYFREDLRAALSHALGTPVNSEMERRRLGLLTAVTVASLPTLLGGFLFYDWFSTTARQPQVIAAASIGFGLLLWLADRYSRTGRTIEDLGWGSCAVIGFAESLALIPGTSRSGVTITAGRLLGFGREEAARFSFLLAIPVGAAAFLKDLLSFEPGFLADGLPALVVGFVVSGLSAYLVIDWLLAWLRRQNMAVFVIYRVILGLVILAVAF